MEVSGISIPEQLADETFGATDPGSVSHDGRPCRAAGSPPIGPAGDFHSQANAPCRAHIGKGGQIS